MFSYTCGKCRFVTAVKNGEIKMSHYFTNVFLTVVVLALGVILYESFERDIK